MKPKIFATKRNERTSAIFYNTAAELRKLASHMEDEAKHFASSEDPYSYCDPMKLFLEYQREADRSFSVVRNCRELQLMAIQSASGEGD